MRHFFVVVVLAFSLSVAFCHSVHAVDIKWLDANTPAVMPGVTWGVPWTRGMIEKGTGFQLKNTEGHAVPVQTWPLATWPDGSLKWTAHAMGTSQALTGSYELLPGQSVAGEQVVSVTQSDTTISVDTGVIQCNLARQGSALIQSITRHNRVALSKGRLVLLNQDQPMDEDGTVRVEKFVGSIDTVTVEQSGPVRAVVKFEGKHVGSEGRAWLPFVVRWYFYAGSDAVRMMHTILYDGDESKDFIRGLGVRFDVPMQDALHDRYIRFVADDSGVFGEAVRGLTGLRRDAGRRARQAQIAGEATPPVTQIPGAVSDRLDLIPAFGEYTLFQLTSDSFTIRKRTADGHAWLKSGDGHRAAGLGYVGGPSGGAAFGLRNFWQSYPAQLDIRQAVTETAQVTVWMC